MKQMKYLGMLLLLASCVREPLAPDRADESLYQQAQANLNAGESRKALQDFQKLLKEYPSSDRVDNSILGLAEAQRALGLRDSAVWTLREMPKASSLYGQSLLRAGQIMLEDMSDWPADSAVIAFRHVIDWDEDADIVGESWYSLGQSFYKMVGTGSVPRPSNYDSALVAYQYVRGHFPKHSRYADALYRIGWAYYQKGIWVSAADSLKRFGTDFPEATLADGAFYWAAKSYANSRQECKAIDLMKYMLEQYPQTDKRASAQSDMAGWECTP